MWREALWLIKDGVATTEQIDDLMTHGFGLRWAQGLFETYRTAGGEAGMKHFLNSLALGSGPGPSSPTCRILMTRSLIALWISPMHKPPGGRSASSRKSATPIWWPCSKRCGM